MHTDKTPFEELCVESKRLHARIVRLEAIYNKLSETIDDTANHWLAWTLAFYDIFRSFSYDSNLKIPLKPESVKECLELFGTYQRATAFKEAIQLTLDAAKRSRSGPLGYGGNANEWLCELTNDFKDMVDKEQAKTKKNTK